MSLIVAQCWPKEDHFVGQRLHERDIPDWMPGDPISVEVGQLINGRLVVQLLILRKKPNTATWQEQVKPENVTPNQWWLWIRAGHPEKTEPWVPDDTWDIIFNTHTDGLYQSKRLP